MDSAFVIYGLVLVVVFVTAAIAGLKAAPYVPTFQRDVRRMLKLAGVKPDELVIDLGAGDGRFLITAAREFQARGIGYEISILPYLVALVRVLCSGVRQRVHIELRDFYQVDLSPAKVVTVFLTPMAMAKLKSKFERELRPGTRIVSFAFPVPDWKPTTVDKPEPRATSVYLYTMPPG